MFRAHVRTGNASALSDTLRTQNELESHTRMHLTHGPQQLFRNKNASESRHAQHLNRNGCDTNEKEKETGVIRRK